MGITAAAVSELRARTGCGMMDCKKALVECNGDAEKAIDYLREKGLAKAAKKADRNAKDGRIFSYIHNTGKVGVMVEIDCETDFVAKTDDFQQLGFLVIDVRDNSDVLADHELVVAIALGSLRAHNAVQAFRSHLTTSSKSLIGKNTGIMVFRFLIKVH